MNLGILVGGHQNKVEARDDGSQDQIVGKERSLEVKCCEIRNDFVIFSICSLEGEKDKD